MTLAPATRLGPYEIVAPLGAGGMGEVYRARDSRLGREVAVKVLPAEVASDPERLRRFEQEARAVGALSHPNVCAIYDVGRHDETPYVVLELLEGESLRQRLAAGPLAVREAVELGLQAAEALVAAHARGIVHRDLKPENLFATAHGGLKVIDFGLAKLTRPEHAAGAGADGRVSGSALTVAETVAGSLVGTCAYMAPEQIRGQPADARADLFALGVVLYELLAGRRPFGGASAIEQLHAILNETPPPLATTRPDAPAPLARLVRRCLVRDPERRLQTAKELRNELDEIRRELDGDTAGDVVAAAPETRPQERRLLLSAAVVRELSERSPRLVGYPMIWVDNGVASDTLVVVLHGVGSDDRPFETVMRESRYRMVTPVMVGFGRREERRPALGLDDHSRLLRILLREIVRELRPARTILVGYSAGADHVLRLASDEAAGGAGIEVAGLLALGANVSAETLFATRLYAELEDGDSHGVLAVLKRLGAGIDSLSTWLVVHNYFTQVFLKLGTQLAPLRRYAADIVAPFDRPGDPLADWYRGARRRIPHVRLVFSNEEAAAAEALLARHLESNVLGDDFDGRSFVIEPVHHLELLDPELLARHIAAVVSQAGGRGASSA
jgi:tRNA A-37 threonylcarbamoyl transferase component Bud32/pimeloyl-ACP methyl ester carboxylesterase